MYQPDVIRSTLSQSLLQPKILCVGASALMHIPTHGLINHYTWAVFRFVS